MNKIYMGLGLNRLCQNIYPYFLTRIRFFINKVWGKKGFLVIETL